MENTCISCGAQPDSTLKCELPMCKNCYTANAQQLTTYKEERTKFFPEIDKIMDHLYLGNEDGANNKDFLSERNITHILMAGSFLTKLGTSDYNYFQIEVDDSTKETLKDHFLNCYKFIDKAIKDEQNVLVHCAAGVSRSASIVIAYLIISQKMDFETAYKFVKDRRQIIHPNSAFVSQLKVLADQVKDGTFKTD